MGYLFICLALGAGLTKGYCGKKTSSYTENIKDAMLANFVRMVFCILIGIVLILLQGELRLLALSPSALIICALSGVSTAVFVISWLLCVKRGAYMMVEVFLMLGVMIPMLSGSILFRENIAITDGIGLLLLVLATVIMCSYNNSQKQKLNFVSILFLVICGVSCGLADLSQKLFVTLEKGSSVSVFNFYTYVFSAAFILIGLLFCGKEAIIRKNGTINPILTRIIGYIGIMSICLFANSFFKTKAALHMDSAQLYALNQGCALILSTLMSSVAFGEKITWKSAIGILVAFAGLVFINLL